MNYEMCKNYTKGAEDIKLIISPSDNLEREFFNQLFKGEAVFETIPNSENIIIKKQDNEKAKP